MLSLQPDEWIMPMHCVYLKEDASMKIVYPGAGKGAFTLGRKHESACVRGKLFTTNYINIATICR
jgi:hypothetical protein